MHMLIICISVTSILNLLSIFSSSNLQLEFHYIQNPYMLLSKYYATILFMMLILIPCTGYIFMVYTT